MAENENFSNRQHQAVEQMKEMSRRAAVSHPNMPPTPPFVRIPNAVAENPERAMPKNTPSPNKDGIAEFLGGMNLPFLDNLKSDGDMGLILGLLLILLSEKSDRLLMLALLYILM